MYIVRQALIIDGDYVGDANWAYGGFARGVVTARDTGSMYHDKLISQVSKVPLVVNIDMSLGKAIYDWISETCARGLAKRNCIIAPYSTRSRKTLCQWNLSDAYIAKLDMPACDRFVEEPGSFTLTIVPGEIEYVSSGTNLPQMAPRPDKISSKWLLPNFLVEIGDLPCKNVTRVESFTWKQRVVEPTAGDRTPGNDLPVADAPDLKLTMPSSDLRPWEMWYIDSVMQGRPRELNGCSIQLLKTDRLNVLAKIGLDGVGIISLGMDTTELIEDDPAHFQVELYCERMSFES